MDYSTLSTILHNSILLQGDTIKPGCNLAVHWSLQLQNGMALVMLSRATKAQDVLILGDFCKESIKCDEEHALPESNRLLEIFDESNVMEKKSKENLIKFSYLNVRSIQSWDGHRKDIVRDDVLMNSDIIGFGETWLHPGQALELEDFQGYFSSVGKGKGIAAFSRMQLSSTPQKVSTKQYSEILLQTKDFDIIYLYCSDGFNDQALFQQFDSCIKSNKPTVIMGDIKEDLLKKRSKMKDFLSSKGFSQLVTVPTFDKGSLIDHIYVNDEMKKITGGIDQMPVYYSDHNIISLYLRNNTEL